MPRNSDVLPILHVAVIAEALRPHLQGTQMPGPGLAIVLVEVLRAAPTAGLVSCPYHHYFERVYKCRHMQQFLQFRLGSLPILLL